MADAPLFFLHFPRTGGTTVDEVFAGNFPAESILRIYSRDDFKKYAVIEEKDFAPLRYITGHLLLTNTNPTQFYGKPCGPSPFCATPSSGSIRNISFSRPGTGSTSTPT